MSKSAIALMPEKPATPAKAPIRNPFDLIRSLSEDADRLFSEFGVSRRWPFSLRTSLTGEALWAPDVEVEERDGTMVVRADLPGLAKADIKVDVTDHAITIEGERKRLEERKEAGYYRSERSYGHFYRSIALPKGAKPDTAKANFANGVLEVTIQVPSQQAPTGRRLTIGEDSTPMPSA